MKIANVQFIPGFSSFFFDDQAAIKSGATQDGFTYAGAPLRTASKRSVNQANAFQYFCSLKTANGRKVIAPPCSIPGLEAGTLCSPRLAISRG